MKKEPFLEKFITDKVKSYVEPSRTGTKKGDVIGLSKAKYKAALYMMYGNSVQEIASELGISYGLLRKWRTEKLFIEVANKHLLEFAEIAAYQMFIGKLQIDVIFAYENALAVRILGDLASFYSNPDYGMSLENLLDSEKFKSMSKPEQDKAVNEYMKAMSKLLSVNTNMIIDLWLEGAINILQRDKITKQEKAIALGLVKNAKEIHSKKASFCPNS